MAVAREIYSNRDDLVYSRYSADYVDRAEWSAVIPAVVLFYSVLLPSEVRVVVADQNLYPARLASIAILPWLIYRMTHYRTRLHWVDAIFVTGVALVVLSFINNYGGATGLRRGGILAFDLLIPYLVGRHCIRNASDLRRFLVFIVPGLMLAAFSMLIEVMAARPLVRPAAASVFGQLATYEGGQAVGLREAFVDQRLGILRATGPFPHPILAGILLSCFLPIFALSSIRGWPKVLGLLASLFAVFAASSAAFLGLLMGAGLIMADALQRHVAFLSWKAILLLGSLGLGVLHIATQKGLIVFLSGLTLNPQTSVYRRHVWHYGSESVAQYPWFGIGFAQYERPIWMVSSSVDNHWLLQAIRFGMLPAITTLLVVIAAIAMLCIYAGRASETDRKLHVGLAIALATMALLGFSVAFFGGAISWFYLLLAISISIALSSQDELALEQLSRMDDRLPRAERPFRSSAPL